MAPKEETRAPRAVSNEPQPGNVGDAEEESKGKGIGLAGPVEGTESGYTKEGEIVTWRCLYCKSDDARTHPIIVRMSRRR